MFKFQRLKPLMLLFSLLSLLAISIACGRDTTVSTPSIVGGKIPDGTSPTLNSTVALVKADGKGYSTVCSGVLIAPRLVLTAAHCVESSRTKLQVLFGLSDTETPAKTVAIESSQTFKKDGSRFFPNFDIAWIKLKEDAPAPWIPIELLRSSETLDSIEGQADRILLAGYGRTASVCLNSECMGRLYEVWTKLEHFFNEAHFVNLLVIGPNPGHGTCNGDSGGPAFVKINDQWMLAGILNGKSPLLNSPNLWEKGVCESGEAIYNFAGAYIHWIEKTSGVKLKFEESRNPPQTHDHSLNNLEDLGEEPSLERLLSYNNHNDDIWATVETLVANFKNPVNRYGASVEELVTQPELAAAAMRRWTEFKHIGLNFDFVISSQKSDQITDVTPIGQLTSLKILTLDSNKISNTKPLKNLVNLEELTLRNNYDYSRKLRVGWDMSFIQNLKELRRLDLSNNSDNLRLESIAWESLVNLETLELSDNGRALNLNAIPWQKLTHLKKLTIRNSQLIDISALRFATSLETLDLSRNEIENVDSLGGLYNLVYLDLSMNRISDFAALSQLPKLESLKALSNLQQSNFCPEGATCVYSPASFSDFESYCRFAFSLSTDDLSHWSGGATVMRLIQIAGVEALRIDGCHDAQTKLSRLKKLDLTGSANQPFIEDLSPISPLTQLETLILANNDLRNIRPLANLTNLKNLDLTQNYIDDISALSGLSSLETLYLDGNLVSSLEPLGNLNGLYVYAQGNPINNTVCPIPSGVCYLDPF